MAPFMEPPLLAFEQCWALCSRTPALCAFGADTPSPYVVRRSFRPRLLAFSVDDDTSVVTRGHPRLGCVSHPLCRERV